MLSGLLFVLAPLLIGYIGLGTWSGVRRTAIALLIQRSSHWAIYLILFLMGISLAKVDNLAVHLPNIFHSLVIFFICLSLSNLSCLFILDRFFHLETEQRHYKRPQARMLLASLQLIAVVIFGFFVGLLLSFNVQIVEILSQWVLLFLLLLIGIQLRTSGLRLAQIVLNKQGAYIALVVILSSWFAGLVAAYWLDMPYYQGLTMASGFGWYSLAGILIGDHFGALYGTTSFLIELFRELFALIFIPLFIRRLPCCAIGFAGATAMDFTLPIIQDTGGARCIPIAIVSGFILSLCVPVFILFFASLLS